MRGQRFSHVLVANRGEIAVRLLRAARTAGYRTTAVYSEADAAAPHVTLADQAVCIGPADVRHSYLDSERILAAARRTSADAIHPGYGMLAENPAFAAACAAAGLSFIGPSPEAIALMGDKRAARSAAEAAGVPCVPGYHGAAQDEASLRAAAERVGFPLMVKAAAGGGGRGMRRVHDAQDLLGALRDAAAEARAAFGDGRLLLERAIEHARHIEVQVAADEFGQVIHLGERECSLQRRYQKVLEEAPSPAVDAALRATMGEAACLLARSCDYRGVGTVEFLLTANGDFYFLEMNTRLQVEHPVTECITGLDLVHLQFQLAQGEPLPLPQAAVTLHGHAIEARICMEDPGVDFLPQTGTVLRYERPDAALARVDDGIQAGQEVTPHYDSMVAKVIVHGESRAAALRKLDRALLELCILGVTCNRDFLRRLLRHPAVQAGDLSTTLIERDQAQLTTPISASPDLWALAALSFTRRAALEGGGHTLNGFTNAGSLSSQVELWHRDERHTFTVIRTRRPAHTRVTCTQWTIDIAQLRDTGLCLHAEANGRAHVVQLAFSGTNTLHMQCDSGSYTFVDGTYEAAIAHTSAGDGRIGSSIAGLVVRLDVRVGEAVKRGQTVAVLEAMKLQHHVLADVDGEVQAIHVAPADQVAVGTLLLEITTEAHDNDSATLIPQL